MYVNDLKTHVNDCLLIQHADDTQFIHSEYMDNLPGLIRKTEETLERANMYSTLKRHNVCLLVVETLSKIYDSTVVQAGDTYIQFSDCVRTWVCTLINTLLRKANYEGV